jgi:hypothetical protein
MQACLEPSGNNTRANFHENKPWSKDNKAKFWQPELLDPAIGPTKIISILCVGSACAEHC